MTSGATIHILIPCTDGPNPLSRFKTVSKEKKKVIYGYPSPMKGRITSNKKVKKNTLHNNNCTEALNEKPVTKNTTPKRLQD